MRTHHVKLLTGTVVLLLAALALGATAITTLNAEREQRAHETKLRKLSEKASKVLPKEAFKPGKYSLTDKNDTNGYHVTALAIVNQQGKLVHLEFAQLDQNGMFNPTTAKSVTTWNDSLLHDPRTANLTKHGAEQNFFNQYQHDMNRLIHVAHTGEENHVTIETSKQ